MFKLGLMFSVLGVAVMAQESTLAIPRNDAALKNAIAGLGKRPLRAAPQQVRMAQQPPAATCSVVRRVGPGPKTGQFTMRAIPAPTVEPMPQVAVPAPACEATDR